MTQKLIIINTSSEPCEYGFNSKGLDGKTFKKIWPQIQEQAPEFKLPFMALFQSNSFFVPTLYQPEDLTKREFGPIGGDSANISDGFIQGKNYLSLKRFGEIRQMIQDGINESELWNELPSFLRKGKSLGKNVNSFVINSQKVFYIVGESRPKTLSEVIHELIEGMPTTSNPNGPRTSGIKGIIEFSPNELYPLAMQELENKGYEINRISID